MQRPQQIFGDKIYINDPSSNVHTANCHLSLHDLYMSLYLVTKAYFGPVRFQLSSSSINPLKTKRRLLYLETQFVPRSKHFSSRL